MIPLPTHPHFVQYAKIANGKNHDTADKHLNVHSFQSHTSGPMVQFVAEMLIEILDFFQCLPKDGTGAEIGIEILGFLQALFQKCSSTKT